MQLKKQNIANAPRLDSRRSSLNVFSCFFYRLFNKLFIQLRRSFPLFITIYGKHFLCYSQKDPEISFFFLSLLTINFCLRMSEDLMHQSIPPAPSPPPPGLLRAFARLVSPGGGAVANFALPGGRAFANPRAIPELLTRTRFPIRI